MKLPSVNTWLFLAAIGAQGWALILAMKNKRATQNLKSAAFVQFQSIFLDGNEERYCFCGSKARIVRQDEFGPIQGILSKKPEYRLTIYATNEAGEYFVFRSSERGSGSIKHLEPKIAAVVLKELYVAPSIASS